MSRVEAAAATRDYALKPRLEYRTVAGVNGPLVILEVRRCPCAQYFLAPVQKSGLRLGMLVVRAFAAADLLCLSRTECAPAAIRRDRELDTR